MPLSSDAQTAWEDVLRAVSCRDNRGDSEPRDLADVSDLARPHGPETPGKRHGHRIRGAPLAHLHGKLMRTAKRAKLIKSPVSDHVQALRRIISYQLRST